MSLPWDALRAGVQDAKQTIQRTDNFVGEMAEIIAGRLRKGRVSASVLGQLKRELRDFNIHTGKWKT